MYTASDRVGFQQLAGIGDTLHPHQIAAAPPRVFGHGLRSYRGDALSSSEIKAQAEDERKPCYVSRRRIPVKLLGGPINIGCQVRSGLLYKIHMNKSSRPVNQG